MDKWKKGELIVDVPSTEELKELAAYAGKYDYMLIVVESNVNAIPSIVDEAIANMMKEKEDGEEKT